MIDSKPLFIFEMANNHQGSVKKGLEIIRQFHKITKGFDFHFAFKLQFRDIPDFIHPDWRQKTSIKYVKRFSETNLSLKDRQKLKKEMDRLGFLSICTPYDEKSVDLIEKMNFGAIKVASCSVPDWPLLERIAMTDKPILVSTAGVSFENLDQIVSFFQNRNKNFALLHCVGEYPTETKNLQLNQIDLFKTRYPNVPVGYSTHEEPDNFEAVQMAIAKGVKIFEKHVQLEEVNQYSATPRQALEWLRKAQKAFEMAGVVSERHDFTSKELADLKQFKRGVFVNRRIAKGELIKPEDTFLAWPNLENQVLATDLSKYAQFVATKTIKENKPLIDVKRVNIRERIYAIVRQANDILKKHQIAIPTGQTDVSVSYHYGLDRFYEIGAVLITCINQEYCKKLIIMFTDQQLPIHRHKKKHETFCVLAGEWLIELDGQEHHLGFGDILSVERGVRHKIKALTDGVLEEVSSTHHLDDSYYDDKVMMSNPNRRTTFSYWPNESEDN